ncbi:MAG: hypothetical protein A2987_06675 [Omnitrophica bacterium RIFCSPLOWO2_01_FULL_45_10]|nr:MAG: hypothetical protein A2987_06675 [Omnitrophica bacterium RIFCSPLOWO2_01_FULL_45_10]
MRTVLTEDSQAEARIQRIRRYLLADDKPRISTHRAKLFTEGYRVADGDPPAIRKAKAFYHVMEHIPIPMIPEQLLMGSPVSFYGAVEIDPEYYANWLLMRVQDKTTTQLRNLPSRADIPVNISPEDIRLLEEEILPFWKDISLGAHIWNDLNSFYPETSFFIQESQAFMTNFGKGYSHTIQDYRSVVTKGLKNIKDEIKSSIDVLFKNRKSAEDDNKIHLYEAMLICADAVILYARRCARLCEAAVDSADPVYAENLKKMSAICGKVPDLPAESWWEVLQSLHFAHMATFLAEGGVAHSFGRMDYYLYPLYRRFIEEARSETKEEAQELLECFFLKCYEYQSLRDDKMARGLAGDRTNDKITLGGVDESGRDVTNELSYRFLEAHSHVHLKEPNLSVRVSKEIPERFILSCLEVVRLGGGLPQFINDDAVIPSLVERTKVDIRDARNYADIGCEENCVDPNNARQSDANPHSNAGYFNLAKILELTLYGGINPVISKRVGPDTGTPETFDSMEFFIRAFKEQLRNAIKDNVLMNSLVEYHSANTIPNPYLSLMHPGPRRSGIDYAAGGCRYDWVGAVGVGLATVADSMMVIEHVIYETHSCSWAEMLSALKADWKGFDKLRSHILSLPRYGSSGKRAESWARWLVENFSNEYEKHSIQRGRKRVKFVVGLFSMGMHLVMGEDILATPDGRIAHEMLSGSVAPSRYAENLGYTATHNAAAKIGTLRTPNGIVFNQVMPKNLVLGPRDLKKWGSLLRTYFDLGGMSVQYSIVGRDELKAAQADPQSYKDLIVRVGGYSARFVDLPKEIQDEFLERLAC